MLPMTKTVFVRAADIYRDLRKKGFTIRTAVQSPPIGTLACPIAEGSVASKRHWNILKCRPFR